MVRGMFEFHVSHNAFNPFNSSVLSHSLASVCWFATVKRGIEALKLAIFAVMYTMRYVHSSSCPDLVSRVRSMSTPQSSGSHATCQLKCKQLKSSMPTFSQKHAAPMPIDLALHPHSFINARAPAIWFIRCKFFTDMISYTFKITAAVAQITVSRLGFCSDARRPLVAVS